MTERLRQTMDRCAAEQYREMHQMLFYSLCRDLSDLVVTRSSVRNTVSAKAILDLQCQYATAETELMRLATAAVLKARRNEEGQTRERHPVQQSRRRQTESEANRHYAPAA